MREVNFSIPNANKASVGITTALYDRRALDCTSTLPLINSLSHLAYLTTSSARIRDILTVDGGVERLVCILKEGRSKDMMDMWKWNLAFQCVVNIGVRGSEGVRTRVVEADMVPVIATILENYVRVIEKYREKHEAEVKRSGARLGSSRHFGRHSEHASSSSGHRAERSTRRPAPPPIEIPQPYNPQPAETRPTEGGPSLPAFAMSSPPERTTFSRPHHHHHRSHETRSHRFPIMANGRGEIPQPLVTAVPVVESQNNFGIRPVRDVDRLPSMMPTLQGEIVSQPESPTTPVAAPQVRPGSPRLDATRTRRRPSIRHQLSMSGDSDDGQDNDPVSDDSATAAPPPPAAAEPIVDIQNEISMQDIVDGEELLDNGPAAVGLNTAPSDNAETETFNIRHRSIDGTIINPANTPTPGAMGFSPAQPPLNVVNPAPTIPAAWPIRLGADRMVSPSILADIPRDEDVLMSLQLLAYVSKYCNLRAYFQKSHLVPRLKLRLELGALDGNTEAEQSVSDEECDEEYLHPDDFNIFPLVEKFTVRHHSQDMQYWAGVVMRNLCRKDDSRGGIRQCAYYQCGRWEEYTRQFAKCRRCRRTKYCSKDCQKSAWVYHRHWCVQATQ